MENIFDAVEAKRNFAQREGDFLVIEIDLALTFLAIARTISCAETRRRNYANARKAHEEAAQRIEKHQTPEERRYLREKLAVLTQA